MAEHEPAPPDPERLLQLKDDILERWQQLPAEHQATIALVLFQQTLEGEYGPWLRSAVKVIEPRDSEGPFRFLPVVRIARSHLAQANLTEEEVAQLDEEDLRYLSHEIARHYTNNVFWEELAFLARKTLGEKRQD